MEYEELEFKKRVGRGTFAVVWKGYWKTKKAGKLLVAIKNITDMDKTEVSVYTSHVQFSCRPKRSKNGANVSFVALPTEEL